MEGNRQQGPHNIKYGKWVDIGNKREGDLSREAIQTMCSLKENLRTIKVDIKKLLKARDEQEEINEIL